MLVSVVIRTFNESVHLEELLSSIWDQQTYDFNVEIVIVDSGSTDDTLEIARNHGCKITHIQKEEFSFGRSLNIGCEFADGDHLVFVSGHCIPVDENWVVHLVQPLVEGVASYSYGCQMGRDTTKYSETQLFKKYYPDVSKVPQQGYFCNNANAAITRECWSKYRFDVNLTGLEDMFLARQLVNDGLKIAYVAEAAIYHIHDESWGHVKLRYEREAIALQRIMPEMHFTLRDLVRYTLHAIYQDSACALTESVFLKNIAEIVLFRIMHYWGTYAGNHEQRKLSAKMKQHYFYPKNLGAESNHGAENHGASSAESKQ